LSEIASARADPTCPGVVLSAAAGVGKSRLAREVSAVAAGEGVVALWAQATVSSAVIPLGALAGVIPDEVRSNDLFELVRRSVAALRERAGTRGLLLVVDDGQLLDAASAALVLQLAATPGLFVLVTVRSGEPTPDAIDALWKEQGARRIELEPLGGEAIAELVELALGGPVEQSTVRRIVDVCLGNPLYAREVVLGALESGQIRRGHGLWRLHGAPTVTPSLTALITRRIGRIDAQLRPVLELLALGEPLRVDELAQLRSYQALEAAEEQGLIAITGPPTEADARLAHPLYGEVIGAQLPRLRARTHRLGLAEMIQRRSPLTPDDALRATRWLLAAGAEVPSQLLTDAAAAANLAADPELGAELARRAIDGGAGLPAVMLLARAHMNRDRFAEAEEVLAGIEPKLSAGPDALEYVKQRLHILYWALHRNDDAQALLHRATAWSTEPEWLAGLEPWRVTIDGYGDGFADQIPSIRETLRQPNLDPDTRRGLRNTEGMAMFLTGQLREAKTIARELQPHGRLRDELHSYALGLTVLIDIESGQDRPGVRAYMRQIMQAAIVAGDQETAGIAASTLATLDLDAGRYHDATRWLAEAELQLEPKDSFEVITNIRAMQVGIACFTGELATADAAADSMRRRIATRGQLPVQQLYVACGEGWAARARSDAAGANWFLERVAAGGDPVLCSRLLHEALRAGARPGPIAQHLAELADACDSLLMEVRAEHAAALAAGDGSALLVVADRLAEVGAGAAAVEAAIAAAHAFIADGRSEVARRAVVRARELHPADQGWELPSVDGLGAVAVQLTAREAQLATLAARGLTNQEIADQLVLSIRTVETVIYRAMHKRGVSSRRDL
jgi:DNA-binding NarL/FixJ family response regulator